MFNACDGVEVRVEARRDASSLNQFFISGNGSNTKKTRVLYSSGPVFFLGSLYHFYALKC